jgi:hypothetical protein
VERGTKGHLGRGEGGGYCGLDGVCLGEGARGGGCGRMGSREAPVQPTSPRIPRAPPTLSVRENFGTDTLKLGGKFYFKKFC